MATILTTVGSIFTSAITWIGQVSTAITASGNEIILLFVVLPLVGLGVGLFRRLINVN